ncbi:zf-HC2 domain-containing protein [Terriglobus saanensis]|uniref:Putative zinc-finger domain-containing protein n=1 Tax=Terriglobus saanensis (strain ATCC BAA-1853 / DSM 23119 / SP1PR4) TaxID=401053 RepID=E8V1R0_TERSS|nr:zf-HC2 domain-containing protein [Terriglobus saanensis]ADV82341.1 hypothetical protein AciPR4_1519 [Terriglobus saanensis SP1PR4]
MTCTEFLAKMTDFFDGHVEPTLLSEIKTHLGECHHCEVVVSTTRQTIEIYRDNQVYELPTDVRERTISSIMARCKEGC